MKQKYKITLYILLLFFLILGVSLEFLGRISFGTSFFIDPLTSLGRAGVYEAPHDTYETRFIDSFDIKNQILYVTDYARNLLIIDISEPKHLREINRLSFDYYPSIVAVSDRFLFLASDRIEIFDIEKDPVKPQKIGEYKVLCSSYCYIVGARVFDATSMFIFLVQRESLNSFPFEYSARIVDIQNPMLPSEIQRITILSAEEVSKFSERPDWKTNVRVAFDAIEDTIVVSLGDYIQMFSKQSDGVFRHMTTYVIPKNQSFVCHHISDLTTDNLMMYSLESYGEGIGCGKSALRIFDISQSTPRELGILRFPYHASDVEIDGGYAYVADRARGMRIVDISEPFSPREAAHYTRFSAPFTEFWQVKTEGDYAYVVGDQALSRIKRIDVVDISRFTK